MARRDATMEKPVMETPAWLSKADIKALVRHRDRYVCTECGMTAEEHRRVYHRNLDVHRVTPGNPYTVAGCVTLCRSCHGDKPRRQPGKGDGGFFVRIPVMHSRGVQALAKKTRRSATSIIQEAIEIHLAKNSLWPPAS